MRRRQPISTLFPYTTLFRSIVGNIVAIVLARRFLEGHQPNRGDAKAVQIIQTPHQTLKVADAVGIGVHVRSEEHTLNSSHSSISYAVFCLKKKIIIS